MKAVAKKPVFKHTAKPTHTHVSTPQTQTVTKHAVYVRSNSQELMILSASAEGSPPSVRLRWQPWSPCLKPIGTQCILYGLRKVHKHVPACLLKRRQAPSTPRDHTRVGVLPVGKHPHSRHTCASKRLGSLHQVQPSPPSGTRVLLLLLFWQAASFQGSSTAGPAQHGAAHV